MPLDVDVLDVVLGALAIIVAVLLYVLSQRTKSLSHAVLTNRSLLTQNESFPLSVVYEGIPLSHLTWSCGAW